KIDRIKNIIKKYNIELQPNIVQIMITNSANNTWEFMTLTRLYNLHVILMAINAPFDVEMLKWLISTYNLDNLIGYTDDHSYKENKRKLIYIFKCYKNVVFDRRFILDVYEKQKDSIKIAIIANITNYDPVQD